MPWGKRGDGENMHKALKPQHRLGIWMGDLSGGEATWMKERAKNSNAVSVDMVYGAEESPLQPPAETSI